MVHSYTSTIWLGINPTGSLSSARTYGAVIQENWKFSRSPCGLYTITTLSYKKPSVDPTKVTVKVSSVWSKCMATMLLFGFW